MLLFKKKQNIFNELAVAFPKSLEKDVKRVSKTLVATHPNYPISNDGEVFVVDSEEVYVPYRCYFNESSNNNILTKQQKEIYACIFLLHHDGYVREKYTRYLLKGEIKSWMLPFLFKLSGEYVIEIIELLYHNLKLGNTDILKEFSKNNPKQAQRYYGKMTSYWDCYYRDTTLRPCVSREGRHGMKANIKFYVGVHLFKECWGIKQLKRGVKIND